MVVSPAVIVSGIPNAYSLVWIVTTLGPSARGTCRLHAAIMARPARTSRRMVMHTLPSGSGACQQDDPGHPPELLPLGLGIQRSEERRVGKECRAGGWGEQVWENDIR